MEKNSFSLLETVLALIILSILVSGFLQFTYLQTPTQTSLFKVKNILVEQQPHPNISSHFFAYTITPTHLLLTNGNTITQTIYQDDSLKLVYSKLNHIKTQDISYKEFE